MPRVAKSRFKAGAGNGTETEIETVTVTDCESVEGDGISKAAALESTRENSRVKEEEMEWERTRENHVIWAWA